MKKTLFSSVVLLFAASTTLAQSDKSLVEQTLNYYLEGGTNNDFETLKKAFHKNATMKFIGQEYVETNALEFFGERMKPGPKQNRTTEITNIDIMGNAASARLVINYPDFSFIDYMHLLKIDGEWKIVSKIFYRDVKTE